MSDCSICKFCDLDYIIDPDNGDEFPFYHCDKGHNTETEEECIDFSEYNYKPYEEKDTECDKCENLQKCISFGKLIDCTCSLDKRNHYVVGIGNICENEFDRT